MKLLLPFVHFLPLCWPLVESSHPEARPPSLSLYTSLCVPYPSCKSPNLLRRSSIFTWAFSQLLLPRLRLLDLLHIFLGLLRMARPPLMQACPPCELCHSPAHVLCPSDDAFLCWRCDSMVHGANFLVARHHRTYLCSCCACPTTMVASGAILRLKSEVCAHCSMDSTEDCCSSGSGNSDSECSMLTSESDEESATSCRSQKIMSCFSSRRKQPLEFELQVHDGHLDALEDRDLSDSMSGVEDELSSSGRFGSSSPTSDIGDDTQENADLHSSRQERSLRRSSKA